MRILFTLILTTVTGFLSLQAQAFDHSHALWTQVLSKNLVKAGSTTKIKYKTLKADPAVLDQYLAAASQVTSKQYDSFSEPEKLAFLFNSYNAFTLKLIISQKEVPKSIRDIKERSFSNPLGNPWKINFFDFLGKKNHLDYLEHEIARKKFDEPRLHFAFNCASVGCPSLLPEAFQASKLDQQLAQAAKDFLSDASRNKWDPASKSLKISKIFEWYGKDFDNSKKVGSLRKFLAATMPLPADAVESVNSGQAKIEFLEYDWNLNTAE